MMNHYALWDCGVPNTVVQAFALSEEVQRDHPSFSVEAIKYLQLEALSLARPACSAYNSANAYAVYEEVRTKAGIPKTYMVPTLSQLCEDRELQNYIRNRKIMNHPCPNIVQKARNEELCRDFKLDVAPPHDVSVLQSSIILFVLFVLIFNFFVKILQLQQSNHYYGAANLYDIVHHVYGGHSSQVLGSGVKEYK